MRIDPKLIGSPTGKSSELKRGAQLADAKRISRPVIYPVDVRTVPASHTPLSVADVRKRSAANGRSFDAKGTAYDRTRRTLPGTIKGCARKGK